jgi:hypothetical protein
MIQARQQSKQKASVKKFKDRFKRQMTNMIIDRMDDTQRRDEIQTEKDEMKALFELIRNENKKKQKR